ncbi:MAG TPA: RNA 2',3'-cyclic phosphodiesterase [Anaerolineae bacterium]|nr:RNA 2',3'-cyclic phosphodiesterase [Anaerolineae bacterium]HOQ98821.1 RNA 2',3'-cyclic phosphodiesterase [Anaerolineae bacterium]HPL28039.1 RNA 2',3'-cyclic phosphodiesterase [Anaerolineae bacterium]
MDTIRAFIAIELDAPLRAALGELQGRLKRAPLGRLGRWVDPGGIHLTLKFLGDVSTSQLPELRQALQRAAGEVLPFDVALAGLGCFPNTRQPRVIWVGVDEPTGALKRLQCAVERELGAIGFPPEGRAFTPHLTLARVRDQVASLERAELGAWVQQQSVGRVGAMCAAELALMQSQLRPGGAVYTCLEAAPLQRREE